MTFVVEITNRPVQKFATAGDALRYALSQVYNAKQLNQSQILEYLLSGQRVVWQYGPNSVSILPIQTQS